MILETLENKLGVIFPAAFHRIYDAGKMKWLEMTAVELKANRSSDINDTDALLMLNCDCELYLFEEIPAAMETLNEWISWQAQDKHRTLLPDVTLIPFGHSGGGDLYCFLYREDFQAPIIVLYAHDHYASPTIIAYDFDEFIYIQMLDAAVNEEELDGAYFQNHLNLLPERYRQQIEGKDYDELEGALLSLENQKINIWRQGDI